ncbi:hypothetical protein ACWGJ9_11615 [Curtobacterium citreum]
MDGSSRRNFETAGAADGAADLVGVGEFAAAAGDADGVSVTAGALGAAVVLVGAGVVSASEGPLQPASATAMSAAPVRVMRTRRRRLVVFIVVFPLYSEVSSERGS